MKPIRLGPAVILAAALAFGLTAGWLAPAAGQSNAAAPPLAAPVRPVVDDYFGTKITDPYRYMENLKDPEVLAWMKAQNDYTRQALERIPGRAALLARIQELDQSAPARVGSLRHLPNGRYFYLKAAAKEDVFKLYMRQGLSGAETLLVDPEKLRTPGGPPYALNYYVPSPDGRYVAYGVSPGGSENAVLHILDTTTGRESAETIDRAQFGEALGWHPDGKAFFYNRLQMLGPSTPITEKYTKSKVYFHLVGSAPEKDALVFGVGASASVKIEPTDIPFVLTSPSSTQAFGLVAHGVQNELTLYVAPVQSLDKPNIPWRKVCDVDDAVTNADIRGDELYLLTHKDASRFKIIRTRASKPDLAHAEVVIPASQAVLTNLGVAKDALYVVERDGAINRLLRLPFVSSAKPEQVPLPLDGTIALWPPDPRVPGVHFTLIGWTRASQIYRYDPQSRRVTNTGLRPQGPFDAPANLESREVLVPSYDGTMVPLSIVFQRGLRLDSSHPALLEGYGGYGITIDPGYDPKYLAWLERGGVLAYAHVRGGGEYGEDWHRAGMKLTKPNTWRDFIACAEYVVREKYTTTSRLAGEGTSAGGILIGRSITERPDLFAAALILVGATDMLRFEFGQNGAPNIPEFGSVKDPDGFKGLYEMSTYAHVKDGTRYPAVLLTAGMNDPRVDPWIPAKMTARLQGATPSGKPVLFRVEFEAGHGIGSTKSQRQQELADEWSFLLWQFGMPGFQPSSGMSR